METEFKQGTGELLIKKLATYNEEYFFREQDKMNYIAFGNTVYMHSKSNSFKKGLFLFGLVKKDFDKWLNLNPQPKFIENYKPTFSAKTINKAKKYSYDINHAYWRIAFLEGYISENTYNHGLRLKDSDENMKQLYCMALSVQGSSKTLEGYIGEKKTGNKLVIQKNPIHKEIYSDIRNRTYQIMDQLAYELGADFIDYNVDCISFTNAKNKPKVEQYLKSHNLTFKQI
jgi:hypothetical protein